MFFFLPRRSKFAIFDGKVTKKVRIAKHIHTFYIVIHIFSDIGTTIGS